MSRFGSGVVRCDAAPQALSPLELRLRVVSHELLDDIAGPISPNTDPELLRLKNWVVLAD
jgi:hypothetical protein